MRENPVNHDPSLMPARVTSRLKINSDGCWIIARPKRNGYAATNVKVDGKHKMRYVHRIAYETFTGPIPDGLVIDHLCRVRACCNPAHLEAVALAENTRRGFAAKASCKHGHLLTGANLKWRRAGGRRRRPTRVCVECSRRRAREGYRRHRSTHAHVPPIQKSPRTRGRTPSERFWEKVDKRGPDECWEWKATCSWSGYGVFYPTRRGQAAHRFAWELTRGPIADGLDLDHLCRNRSCVNPDHMEPVTRLENCRRIPANVAGRH